MVPPGVAAGEPSLLQVPPGWTSCVSFPSAEAAAQRRWRLGGGGGRGGNLRWPGLAGGAAGLRGLSRSRARRIRRSFLLELKTWCLGLGQFKRTAKGMPGPLCGALNAKRTAGNQSVTGGRGAGAACGGIPRELNSHFSLHAFSPVELASNLGTSIQQDCLAPRMPAALKRAQYWRKHSAARSRAVEITSNK